MNIINKYEVTLFESNHNTRVAMCDNLELAFKTADAYFTANHGSELILHDRNAAWRQYPASQPQKNLMLSLGIVFPPEITKGQAGTLIDTELAKRRRVKA